MTVLEAALNEPLYYELEKAPGEMSIDDYGNIQWEPGYNDHGTYLVRVLASTDAYYKYNCFDTKIFVVTVEDRSIPPRIESTPVTITKENERYIYDVDAVDDDGPLQTVRLRYFLGQCPEGMEIDTSRGIITWQVPHTAARWTEAQRTVSVIVQDS